MSTKPCEMASACQNTFDRKLIIFPSFFCFSTERPDFTDAIILRKGASVEHVVISLHFLQLLVCKGRFISEPDVIFLCFVRLGICQCLLGLLLLLPSWIWIPSASGCFPQCYKRLKKTLKGGEKHMGAVKWGIMWTADSCVFVLYSFKCP